MSDSTKEPVEIWSSWRVTTEWEALKCPFQKLEFASIWLPLARWKHWTRFVWLDEQHQQQKSMFETNDFLHISLVFSKYLVHEYSGSYSSKNWEKNKNLKKQQKH